MLVWTLQLCKHAYDKDIRHTIFQTGDLVLRYTLLLKLGKAN